MQDVVVKLTSALEECDVLITSGGVSMGEKVRISRKKECVLLLGSPQNGTH